MNKSTREKALQNIPIVGIIVGGASGTLYLIISMVLLEISEQPSFDMWKLIIPFVASAFIGWLLLPAIFGMFITVFFSFILTRYQPSRLNYIVICILSCLIFDIPLILLTIDSYNELQTTHSTLINPFADIILLIVPLIIFNLAGLFVSSYLQRNSQLSSNVNSFSS